MFDHVGIYVRDLDATEAFYTAVLAVLGAGPPSRDPGLVQWEDVAFSPASEERPLTRGLHIAFVAPSRDDVDAFWEAGRAAGHPDAGEPGPRPAYGADYYGAFLLDPDGHSAEAVHHGRAGPPGVIDHLWLRVRDVAVARDFYQAVAPHLGIWLHGEPEGRAHFRTAGGSFSLVPGDEPTENVHIAFGAPDRATVDSFHAAALAAGARDNGAPGERPQYHPGYYGAFALDPDQNNIEAVFHDRRG